MKCFLCCSVFHTIITHAQIFNFQPVQTLSPGVDLPVKVVEALVELLDVSFLPLNVRTVLLELGGHVVTAVFGCTQVLLSLSNDRPLRPQI